MMKWVEDDGRSTTPTWFLVLGERPLASERTVATVQHRRDLGKYPSGRAYYWVHLLFDPAAADSMPGWLSLVEAQQHAESLVPALWQLACVEEEP